MQRHVGVRDTPVGAGACGDVAVGIEREFVAADIEADVERLIEVRLYPQQLGVPELECIEVRGGVDDCAQSQEHGWQPPQVGEDSFCRERSASS